MSSARLWGAAVALVAAALLIWTVIVSFGPKPMVMPEVALKATSPQGATAEGILRKRTELQRWRAETGPSPQAEASQGTIGGDDFTTVRPDVADPGQLVQSWLQDRPQQADMVRKLGFVAGRSSLPYPEANVFEQPQGRDWRSLHNDQVRYGGGWIIFGMTLVLASFLLLRGRIPLKLGFSGEKVLRFGGVERANHWMTASSFIVMALTGLIIIYGKTFLLPLMGDAAYGSVASWSAWFHMAFAIPFVIGICLMIGLWLIDNIPDHTDWVWLKHFGGLLSDDPNKPPARKFNAGQKFVFWAVVLSGLALMLSGLALMFPFYWFGYDGMQWAQLVHAVIALLIVALILGHIYMGTVGMEGAFDAMWSGFVDRNWAKEHHKIWLEKITGRRSGAPQHERQRLAAE